MSKLAIEEPFRTLQGSLLLRVKENKKCFLITSARDGDGKSTVCAHLAQATGSSGARVLVIDGNLRHSSLHKAFGTSNYIGLLHLLNGTSKFEDAVQKIGPQLSILPSGAEPNYKDPLPLGERLQQLIHSVRRSYDIVLVDSPPLLSWSDAALLAPVTDGVIVVLRAGVTSANDVQILRARLESGGAEILGSVLNAIPKSSGINPKAGSTEKLETQSSSTGMTTLGLNKASVQRLGQ